MAAIPTHFCVYAAFAPLDQRATFLKVGLAAEPIRRICSIQYASPLPVQYAQWAHVGTRKEALRVERLIQDSLSAFNTRGEWFEVNPSHPTWSGIFRRATVDWVLSESGKLLFWNAVDMNDVNRLSFRKSAWLSRTKVI